MITIRSPLTKTLLLLTLTTLTIGLGTSVSFNSPGDNEVKDNDVTISVDSELSDTGNVDNITINATGTDGFDVFKLTEESASNWTGTFDKGDAGGTNGDYDLEATLYEGGTVTDSTSISITMETSSPEVSTVSDSEYVSNDPEIEFEISDEYSDIENVDASVSSSDGDVAVDDINDDCEGERECSANVQIDTNDLEDGDQFSVDLEATDEAGNTDSNNAEFTIDNEWDGDSSADVEWDSSGSDVLTGSESEDQDVLISFQPDSVSETSIVCEVDGDEVDTDSVSASDEEENAYCEFDSEEYSSSIFDLTVEAEDEAGNSQTLVDGKELIWDTERPTIDNLEQPEGISTFNKDFDLDVLISDDASGIAYLEYYFDANTDTGEGTSVSLEDAGATTIEKTFTVSPDLDRGSHTVYVRARDDTGQISDVKEFDFEYYPDTEAEIILGVPERLEITSGSSKSFTLSIENGAPFFLNGVEVSGSGAVWDGTKTASDLKSGDSVERNVTVDASNLDVGVYNMTLQTANYDSTSTIEVVVRATESQKESISQDLDNWESKESQLRENISSISTLDEKNGNITQFTDKVKKAKEAADKGNYYQAKAYLSDINESFDQASETFSEKQEIHKKNQRNMLFMVLFGAVVLIGGGVTGFLLYREPDLEGGFLEDVLPEHIELPELPGLPELGIMEKIREIKGGDDEDEEQDIGYTFEDFA